MEKIEDFLPQMNHQNHNSLKIHLKDPVVQGKNELHLDRIKVAKQRELIHL